MTNVCVSQTVSVQLSVESTCMISSPLFFSRIIDVLLVPTESGNIAFADASAGFETSRSCQLEVNCMEAKMAPRGSN